MDRIIELASNATISLNLLIAEVNKLNDVYQQNRIVQEKLWEFQQSYKELVQEITRCVGTCPP